MKKPTKPPLKVTGLANIKDRCAKFSESRMVQEGGECVVIDIPSFIKFLQETLINNPETTIVSSKKSIYLGVLKESEHKKDSEKYERDLKDWKQKRKASLQKQLDAL